jgi:hypothetical protein
MLSLLSLASLLLDGVPGGVGVPTVALVTVVAGVLAVASVPFDQGIPILFGVRTYVLFCNKTYTIGLRLYDHFKDVSYRNGVTFTESLS